jgi:predicted nucleic acid-binding protein
MLLDTDIMVDVLRGYTPAVEWITSCALPVGIPGLVAMELLQGCRSQAEQHRVERELMRFNVYWPTAADCQRAYDDFAAYRLSDALGILDSLIAHTSIGVDEPLATFNIKHYRPIAGLNTIQPY